MKQKIPRIYCAKCRYHVDAIHIETDLRTMRVFILVECHGETELMHLDKIDFLQVIERDAEGTAFENKLEDHSDEQKTTNQTEIAGPSVPGQAVALRGV